MPNRRRLSPEVMTLQFYWNQTCLQGLAGGRVGRTRPALPAALRVGRPPPVALIGGGRLRTQHVVCMHCNQRTLATRALVQVTQSKQDVVWRMRAPLMQLYEEGDSTQAAANWSTAKNGTAALEPAAGVAVEATLPLPPAPETVGGHMVHKCTSQPAHAEHATAGSCVSAPENVICADVVRAALQHIASAPSRSSEGSRLALQVSVGPLTSCVRSLGVSGGVRTHCTLLQATLRSSSSPKAVCPPACPRTLNAASCTQCMMCIGTTEGAAHSVARQTAALRLPA